MTFVKRTSVCKLHRKIWICYVCAMCVFVGGSAGIGTSAAPSAETESIDRPECEEKKYPQGRL